METSYRDSFKKSAYLSLGVMIILLVGSVIYYRERMVFIDAAGILFNTINTKSLLIPENRLGSFITAMIPYIGTQLKIPFTSILIAYSISFNLFFLIIISILIFWFKEYKLAILMALYFTLFVSDVYFWTNNEIHQGIAWMFLDFGLMFYLWKRNSNVLLQFLIFTFLSALAISCHPLIIVAFAFLWCFFLIEGSFYNTYRKNILIFSFILILLFAIKVFLSLHQAYDTTLLNKSTKNSIYFFQRDFNSTILGIFLNYLIHNYWITILLIVSVSYSLVQQQKLLMLSFVYFSAFTFLILLSLVFTGYHYPTGNLFYLEAEWQLMAIILGAPFVYVVLTNLSTSSKLIVLSIIFATRIIYIQMAYPTFHQRVEYTENILKAMRKKNIYKLMFIKDSNSISSKTMINLGLEHESFILSKLDGDNPQRIIVNGDAKTIPYLAWAGKSNLITYFGPVIYPLNSNYFKIDTNSLYSIFHEKQLFSTK